MIHRMQLERVANHAKQSQLNSMIDGFVWGLIAASVTGLFVGGISLSIVLLAGIGGSLIELKK